MITQADIEFLRSELLRLEAEVRALNDGITEPVEIQGAPENAAAGTAGLFKCDGVLVGWKKTGESDAWEQMSVADMLTEFPTRLWTEFVHGVDSYPWYGLRKTYDYVRALEL